MKTIRDAKGIHLPDDRPPTAKRPVLRVTFKPRDISSGVVKVLRHLYYYTVQYGVSVKQFTGKHQDYWAALPVRLRDAAGQRKLEKLIDELQTLAQNAEKRLDERRMQLEKWSYKEIVLSAELSAVMAALPEPLLSRTVRHLANLKTAPARLRLVDLDIAKSDMEGNKLSRQHWNFVEPDALLLGDRYLVMIEVKTKGHDKASRIYPPRQLLNYLRLAEECEYVRTHVKDSDMPECFIHLILVPTREAKWLDQHEDWVRQLLDDADGKLRVDVQGLIRLGGTLVPWLRSDIARILDNVPVYYRSWADLQRALQATIDELGDDPYRTHWERVGEEIERLAARAVAGV